MKMTSYCRQFPGAKGGNPYVNEHTAMINSIRGDGTYINHAMTVAESTFTCIMAREAAYSGIEITWDMILNSKQDLMPKGHSYNVKTTVTVPG